MLTAGQSLVFGVGFFCTFGVAMILLGMIIPKKFMDRLIDRFK